MKTTPTYRNDRPGGTCGHHHRSLAAALKCRNAEAASHGQSTTMVEECGSGVWRPVTNSEIRTATRDV